MFARKKIRIFLILLNLIAVSSFVGMLVINGHVKAGKLSDDWIGVFGLMFSLATIANVVLSYLYAGYLGRERIGWALAGLLFPYFAPLILAFLSEETYKPGKGGKGKFTLSDNLLEFKQGMFKKISLPLDSLRIVTLFLPGSSKWRIFFSTSESEYINLDLLPEENFSGIIKSLTEIWDKLSEQTDKKITDRDKLSALDCIKLYLVDYDNNFAGISLKDIKLSNVDFFEKLSSNRKERINRLEKWKGSNPEVVIKGSWGSTAVLSKEGFKKGKNLMPWNEVDTIYEETSHSLTSMTTLYVLPKGVKSGLFSFKKFGYGMRVPTKQKELYKVECNFFRNIFFSKDNSIDEGQLAAFLSDKAICLKCGTVYPVQTEKISKCCGAALIRFCAAEKNQKCSFCGFEFSDETATIDQKVSALWEKKGLRCKKCGNLYCIKCAPKDSQGNPSFLCSCSETMDCRI